MTVSYTILQEISATEFIVSISNDGVVVMPHHHIATRDGAAQLVALAQEAVELQDAG